MIRSHGLCQACRSKELTPKKKDRITSIKNSSKKKKLENPDLSGFFRLMLEELNNSRMSMTGKAIRQTLRSKPVPVPQNPVLSSRGTR